MFLLTPADALSLPRMMQSLGRRYVRAINARHRRIKQGDLLVLEAMGGGLSWGSAVVTLVGLRPRAPAPSRFGRAW